MPRVRLLGYPPHSMRFSVALLCMLLAGGASLAADPPVTFAEKLAAGGGLDIGLPEARRLESRIGQLLVVNVDGFGYNGPLAVLPEFLPMVQRLQVGGVIPHYGSHSYKRIRGANRALTALTHLPLLICCDMVSVTTGSGGASRTARFGDGYAGGFLGRFRALQDPDFQALAALNAAAFAAIGINVSLGPTVDDSTADTRTVERARMFITALRESRIEPVIKHFPFLPTGADLHHESPDTRVAMDEAVRRLAVFGELADEAGILMTTHTYDSLVDPRTLVTFSAPWHALLLKETGFGGLLLSDGLLMLRRYKDRSLLGDAGEDPTTAWAIRAILAGHDMVIVEGGSATTYRVFEGLLAAACRETDTGRRLRARIDESYERIALFKEERAAALRATADITPRAFGELVRKAAALQAR